MIQILNSFPQKDVPRQSQIDILSKIEQAIHNKKKFIIIQAPTGSGKSHIAATIANHSRNPSQRYIDLADRHELFTRNPLSGYVYEDEVNEMDSHGCAVLTVTKALQNQYEGLFDNAKLLKGKQNYVCKVDEDFDCDLAPCVITPKLLVQCKQLNRCPFLEARKDAFKYKFSIFNYSAYLSLPQFVQRRQFLICDEASELEDELVKFYSCEIVYKDLKFDELGIKKLEVSDPNYTYKWLTDVLNAVKQKHESLQEAFNKNKDNKRKLMSSLNKIRIYKQMFEKILLIVQNWYNTEYVIEPDIKKVKLTPLHVNILASNFFKQCDTVILMSGTIIDHTIFARTLGISEYEYIEVPSEFEAKHSPIYCLSKFKLNYKNIDEHMPKLVEMTKKICNQYPDDKGIIHTHTFKITESLQKAFKGNSRFLSREPGVTNEVIVNMHKMRSDSTVLISPSLGFGTDLADEFGRFSVILKTPYLPLNEKRIKILAERNIRWYQMRALVNLVQMCGRTTRSKDDYSDTFILDGTAVDLIKMNIDKLPKYFLERLQ